MTRTEKLIASASEGERSPLKKMPQIGGPRQRPAGDVELISTPPTCCVCCNPLPERWVMLSDGRAACASCAGKAAAE